MLILTWFIGQNLVSSQSYIKIKKKGGTSIYNEKGKEVGNFKSQDVLYTGYKDYFLCKKESGDFFSRYALFRITGKQITKYVLGNIVQARKGLFVFSINGKQGLINDKGSLLLEPKYDLIFIHNHFVVAESEENGMELLDYTMKLISNEYYSRDIWQDERIIVIHYKDKKNVLTHHGKRLFKESFCFIETYKRKIYARNSEDENWQIFSPTGNFLGEVGYDFEFVYTNQLNRNENIGLHQNGNVFYKNKMIYALKKGESVTISTKLFLIRSGSQIEVYNINAKLLFETTFENYFLTHDFTFIKYKDEAIFINSKGKVIKEKINKDSEIKYFQDRFIVIEDGEKVKIFSSKGLMIDSYGTLD